MRKIAPLVLVALMLSGFRAFPSLSEPDPKVVFGQFQTALNGASSVEDLYRFMSARKKREYQRKAELAEGTPGASDKLIDHLRQDFFLMKATLAAQELHTDSAILVYQGAVNLDGTDYVPVTMGVLLVREDGEWKVDRDKITYKAHIEGDPSASADGGRRVF